MTSTSHHVSTAESPHPATPGSTSNSIDITQTQPVQSTNWSIPQAQELSITQPSDNTSALLVEGLSSGVLTIPSLGVSSTSSSLSTSSFPLVNFSTEIASPTFSPLIDMSNSRDRYLSHVSHHSQLQPNSPSNRSRSRSRDDESNVFSSPRASPVIQRKDNRRNLKKGKAKQSPTTSYESLCQKRALSARKENDSMVYLDGPRIYTCGACRTHLMSHDEILSKNFHGRHGRAYLCDQCVNYTTGKAEDRQLITGLHSVCDLFCKRCKTLIGWTYARAYEPSQKYKEGKFIIEKINLHMEENNSYEVCHPPGERRDRWRIRAMSWGSDATSTESHSNSDSQMVYEYQTVE